MIAAALALCVALTGCATRPVYVDRVVEKLVPVPIPCVEDVPPRWPYETTELAPEAGPVDLMRALAIEIQQREAVEVTLRALLVACENLAGSEQPPNPGGR